MKFEPESYNALNRFLMRANPGAVRELARAITNSPNIDQSLNESASLPLNRKYALDVPLKLKFVALDGRKVDLETMRGKVVLVAFWATGCVPCLEKLPELKSLYQKYHERGFEVIGISTDAQEKAVRDVIQKQAIPWPVGWNVGGSTNKFARECGASSIPDYWLVDARGITRELMADSNLEEKIKWLLSEKD